jgi:phenylacetic acid degradation operon negative regulatory protein
VARLFGVNENRARVALSRMVGSGEATTDGAGRYRLAGHLLERRRRQEASRAGRTGAWSGGWHLVVLTAAAGAADARGARRAALLRGRLGELRQGVWMRPDNLALDVHGIDDDEMVVFGCRSRGDDVALAGSLWDLHGWAERATHLLDELDALAPVGPGELAPGFVLSAAVLRHFQADPLLPTSLLPSSWPGDELRRRYDDWDARYRRVLVEWSRSG